MLLAKTTEPNPKLPGTLYSAAEQIEAAGGQALPVQTDIRDENAVAAAVAAAVQRFGGIDILVNNASAISLTPTDATPMKRFDLMFGVNVRGTYCCTQACLPELIKSAKAGRNPHVLNMSPPLSMKPHWFQGHVAYTMAKYGMSECTLGHAAEFKRHGIAVNSLWPRTAIATAALQMIPGADLNKCRKPEILADAAHIILTSDAKTTSGNFFIDDTLLAQHGITDLDRYAVHAGHQELHSGLLRRLTTCVAAARRGAIAALEVPHQRQHRGGRRAGLHRGPAHRVARAEQHPHAAVARGGRWRGRGVGDPTARRAWLQRRRRRLEALARRRGAVAALRSGRRRRRPGRRSSRAPTAAAWHSPRRATPPPTTNAARRPGRRGR